ncbi:MAG: phosphoenolpyruvate carboxylase [Archaeoglobaceae archaeon]
MRITTAEEVDEAIVAYAAYGCDEVMIDYEGKATPYSQPKDIVLKAFKSGISLGEEMYITVRLPNPKLEEFDRVALSLEAAIVANYFSVKYMDRQAVRWVILPMVEDVETIALVRRMLRRKCEIYKSETKVDVGDIEVIPLIEDAVVQLKTRQILDQVFKNEEDIRVFFGKSDSAVKRGHLASALAIAYVLSKVQRLEDELGLKIRPIIGMGSPPFRGGLNSPELCRLEVLQYAGYHTATIQSAIRYDVSLEEYRKAKETILNACCNTSSKISEDVVSIIMEASAKYRSIVSKYVEKVIEMAKLIPSTRDRISWKEYGRLFSYDDQAVCVPRAIVYTAAWYSIGLPPILLDAPYIVELAKSDKLDEVSKILPAYLKEIEYDMKYFDPVTVRKYLGDGLVKSVLEMADHLAIEVEPNPAYLALLRMPRSESNIIAMGKLRKFLG